ncbi:LOW QUALITY PROTEIN: uncharacterized protein LOC133919867 [Phragmites australis]|uniref:LOW QUALITY PROTEIN: uncharacterized protein LOC133919867 n=1 Tax=Phragmites australis TaxID=29695 RepID=UPI002D791D6E|nr:LOW QUALITY PROTEIN: uncharacterized protein LOC133919867 [Phragmites australis]
METWTQSFAVSHKVRLVHILKNLHTSEVKIYSDASREFIELLDGESGGEVLQEYVQQSPRLVELVEAWRLHREKPGMAYILSLFATLLGQPSGKSRRHGSVKKSLDGVARMILEDTEKMGNVYLELNSGEFRRQNAALDLLAAIVRRGGGLASEVAERFDFKMAILPQLAGTLKKKGGGRDGRNRRKVAESGSTRRSFIGFAMSFLEVGNPRLLRWVLQQKELYSGVLRGIGNDDAETVMYVLSTLRDNVLVEESLVPPGLRSVLFGSATLEQLSLISGNLDAGEAADIAHEVLVMVCTDPKNGLMPSSNLRGNEKRLLDLMKKLKATEVAHHKSLLLAIVSKRLSLCSAYMNEFPYNIEPRSSPSWFAAISLAADMISSAKCDSIIHTLSSNSHGLVSVDDEEVQVVLKCIIPHVCSRAVINRGLLHSDDLVKHGSLRLVFESVNLLCYVIEVINDMASSARVKSEFNGSANVTIKIDGFPVLSYSDATDASLVDEVYQGDEIHVKRWISLREYIQDEVHGAMPDPQVLLKLLSSASQKHQNYSQCIRKKSTDLSEPPQKKRRCDASSEVDDIIIGGIDVEQDNNTSEEQDLDLENDHATTLCEIWGLDKQDPRMKDAKVVEDVFHSKLLDVLRLYLRVMPSSFDGSFDFFRVIPPNPLDLSKDEQESLLSLLLEYSGQSGGCWDPERVPESMYKHLQPLIYIMLHSQIKSIRDQAYILVKAAMASSGVFDKNFAEIDAWLVFLPGYEAKWCVRENLGVGASNKLSHIVIPFLCDAISVVGNNLYKYQEHTCKLISKSGQFEGCSSGFSPLIVCVLQKCLRILDSESGSMKLHEKSTISLYVCNTIHLILQSQVDVQLLPDLVSAVLNERFNKFSSEEMNSRIYLSEWRPLINMLHFLSRISDRQNYSMFTMLEHSSEFDANSLYSVTRKVEEMLSTHQTNSPDDVSTAFLFSIICAPPKDIIGGFPDLLDVMKTHFPSHLAFLSSVLFLQHDYLAKVASCWPNMFCNITLIKDDINVDHVNTVQDKCQNHSVSTESASISTFLRVSPFYALLPSVLSLAFSAPDEIREAHNNTLLRLLQLKLSECTFSELTLYLRVILFWSHHLLSSYTIKCSNILEQLCHLCFALVDSVFERIQVLTADTAESKSAGPSYPVQLIQDIVDSVLQHPIIALSLSCSLSNSQELADESSEHLEEVLTVFSKENLHLVDRFVLNVLSKLYDLLLKVGSFEANYSRNDGPSLESLFAAPKLLLGSILLLFKEKFELCIVKENFGLLLPNFYMVRTLSKFLSPGKLLELANWMFTKLDSCSSSGSPAFVPAVLVCLYIADVAMEMYCYLQNTDHRSESCLLWDLEIHNSDITAIKQAYHIILHFATKLNLEFADHCLLKMLSRIHHTERSAEWSTDYIVFHMILSTMVINTPINVLHHCIFPTSKVKAKAALLLLEACPMHMSLFGQMFVEVLEKDTSVLQVKKSDCNASWAQEDGAILLLPAALSYLKCHSDGNRQCAEFLEPVPIFYCGLLLGDKGFSSWKNFATRSIFEEDFSDFTPTSVKDIMIYFSDTLLGKSVTMLHYYFASKDMSRKQRLEIIGSIFPESSELLDSDVNDVSPTSCNGIMKLTNELFAKISLIRLLLSPPRKSLSNEVVSERESKRVNKAKLNFIGILVRTMGKILSNFPWGGNILSHSAKEQKVICFLEYVILKNIIELSSEIQTHLNQLKSIPFLNQFIRSSLLHRFNDPVTIKAVRCILVVLSQGKFSADEILELILGHSNFVSTITRSEDSEYPFACSTTGGLLQPVPSILKSVDSSFAKENKPEVSVAEERRIETIRLLRVLYDIKSRQQNNSLLNESRELVFLLLSVYGATLSETDLEILHLMNEIESSECRIITEVDHLWGSAALKFKQELKLDFSKSDTHDTENAEITERRRALFRENIPIDSKHCAKTALQFCYKRSSRASAFSLEQLQRNSSADSFEVTSQRVDMVQIYDPMFILRFSIHTLLMGYIEPAEFSRLGLLAITLVSIASPDQELRMLGYESLGTLKKSLEASQKSKETWHLQLLLTYLQNGISKQWQRIPSIIAVFAAEASLTLLDSSHSQFTAISNFLMHSTSVSLQSIPLFPTLLRSSSVHFKAERLWMLRLLYAGSNLADDAKLYKRGNVLELALAFCSSPVSESESKVLILKVLKKCVKLPVLAHHLVKECGLLLWLSSVISIHREGPDSVENPCSRVTELALEVVNDLISSRLITDWLQETALEQLSAISSYLYVLLVKDAKLLKGNVPLLTSVLSVITSTMRLSMKRKIYQPHFTLSLHGVFNLCQAIGGSSRSTELKLAMKLCIDAILMNGPMPILSEMDKSRISMVVSWATSNIFWLHSNQRSVLEMSCEEPVRNESLLSKIEPVRNESLLSKILRWLVASVILGRISSISHEKSRDIARSTNSLETLRSFLNNGYERVETVNSCSANDTLTVIILYLQDRVQNNSDSLPSVVMALCLLLLDRSGNQAMNKYLADNRGNIEMLCSKIHCPAECNPSWRWHYYQPWKDPALQHTEIERTEEEQACRSLLVIFSNALSSDLSDFPVLSLDDVEKAGLFQWERDSMIKQPWFAEELG